MQKKKKKKVVLAVFWIYDSFHADYLNALH